MLACFQHLIGNDCDLFMLITQGLKANILKIKVGNYQEMAQPEYNFHSKNRVGRG